MRPVTPLVTHETIGILVMLGIPEMPVSFMHATAVTL